MTVGNSSEKSDQLLFWRYSVVNDRHILPFYLLVPPLGSASSSGDLQPRVRTIFTKVALLVQQVLLPGYAPSIPSYEPGVILLHYSDKFIIQ